MKVYVNSICILITCFSLRGQTNIETAPQRDLRRKIIAGSTLATSWAGSTLALYHIWYGKNHMNTFHIFNDANLWLHMDKVGHFYSSYQISNLSNALFEWAGYNNKKSAIKAGIIGLGYQTTLECFDGFSPEWGFSWNDMYANIMGSSLFAIQEIFWNEQRILPKFSYRSTPYAQIRPEVLGSTPAERLLKDYNGQTYWLSFHPLQSLKNNPIPKWVCFSIGYSVHEKIKGDKEIFTDEKGLTYQAQREWLLSLDIDFSKLPIKQPTLKKVLKHMNCIKVPFPAIRLRNGILSGLPIYF